MTPVGDWGEIIDELEAERFVGREQELAFFQQHITRTPPRYLIFYIMGQGGVGKTTLLNRYREISKNFGLLLADCDEQQKDIPMVLGRFAQQLTDQGVSLKRFSDRYKTYCQKMDEIENDPKAPQGLVALFGRTVVRAAFIGGDLLPGVRKGLEYLPKEAMEAQAGEWADYLAKKLTNKDEVALIREPIPILTSLFFEDVNEIAQKQRILFCFENFEATSQELQVWFLRLREYKPSQHIRMIIAGRNKPGAQWDPLRNVTAIISLDIFTEQEAEAFLDLYDIRNKKRRQEILQWSGRLPVLMSWLAAPQGKEPDPSVPTSDIVDRFLRWVTEPVLREVALRAALPRTFNLDVLTFLLKGTEYNDHIIDGHKAFAWLQTMPFVKQTTDGWRYHEVVRYMMLQYQQQKSPQAYRLLHTTLANFYHSKRNTLGLSEDEQWTNEQWRKDTLAYVYHCLASDPIKLWIEIINLFTLALRKRRAYALEIIELICSSDVYDQLSHTQQHLLQLFHQQLQAVKDGSLQDGFSMFDRLCSIAELSSEAKSYVFAYRGEGYRLDEKWDKALHDFEEALQYIPNDAWTLTRRGITYRLMERYQEALADFDRVLALDDKDTVALVLRGWTYFQLERYQEALADFDRVLALDERYVFALARRGWTYFQLERYQEALADFDRALVLDDKDARTLARRGETYRLMERYQEALADFDRVLALNDKDARTLARRGETYFQLERYQEALADFDRAITLDDTDAGTLARRGETYFQLERYQEALADFEQALALDDKDDWHWYCRAQIHLLVGQKKDFESDLHTAIELAQTSFDNTPDDWRIGFNLAFYNLVSGNFSYAESLYDQLASKCSLLPTLQGAVNDLTHYIRIQPSNILAQHIRELLQSRISDLKLSSTE